MRRCEPVAARLTTGARWEWVDSERVGVAGASGRSSLWDEFSRTGEDEWKPMVLENIVHARVFAEQDWLRFQAEIRGLDGRNQSQ
jgi:hypothetical protein